MPAVIVDWTEAEYGTGVDIADKEHQKLFDIINRLAAAKNEHDQSHGEKHLVRMRSLFEELKDYTQYHFEHEERLFVATSYPNTASHVSQHRKFIAKLHEAERIFAESNQFPESMFDFLVKWLSVHIKSMDREYAHYLGPSQDAGLSGVFFNCLRFVATQHSSEKAFTAALDKVQRNGNWTAAAAGSLIASSPISSSSSSSTSSSNPLSISDSSSAPRLTSFDSSRRYPELLFYQLLERVGRTLRMAEADILSEVGVHFVKSMSPLHLQMLGTRFPEAIRRLNHLHSTIKVLPAFSHICPPTFRCVEKTGTEQLKGSSAEETSSSTGSQRSLSVYYTPARDSRIPLLPFAAGALKGLAQLCGIRSLHVSTVSLVPNANKEYEFLAQWSSDHCSDEEPQSEPLTLKSSAHVRIDPESLIQLFPFHFGLKKDGRVCQIGPSLLKLVPSLKRSSDPNQSIAICHPNTCSGPLVVPKILAHSGELFWLSVKSTKTGTAVPLVVMMRGEFVRARGRTRTNSKTGKKSFVLVFCGEPIFADMESVQACGLDISDFALNSEISALMAPALPVHQISARDVEHPSKTEAPVKSRKLLLGLRTKTAARSIVSTSVDDTGLEVELPNNNIQIGPTPISVLSDCLFRDRFSQFALSIALLRLSARTPSGNACIDSLLTFYSVVGGVFDLLQSLLEREFRVGSDILFRVDSPQIKAVLIFFTRSGDAWRHDTIAAMQRACNDTTQAFDVTAAALACLMICSEQVKRIPPSIGHLLQWVHSKTLASFNSPILADQAVVNLLFLRFLLPQLSTDMSPTAKNCLKVAKAIQQSAASSQIESETNPLQTTLNQTIRTILSEQFSTWEQVGTELPTKFGSALANIRDFILQNYEPLNEDFDFRPCLAEIGRAALARSVVSR